MIFLTDDQITRLRNRAADPGFEAAGAALVNSAAPLLESAVTAPPAGIAGWNHDYYCPEHYSPLQFDLNSPHSHRCMIGGEMLRGAVYDACWWRKVNLVLAHGAFAASLLWTITGKCQYQDAAQRVLLDYAQRYPDYEIHGAIPHNGSGKANCQTLDEASWIIPLALAYDMLRGQFSQKERSLIEQNLFKECADFLMSNREEQLHNHQCWIAAAIGTLGLILGDQTLIDAALYDKWGLMDQLERGVLVDGLWIEGTPNYHFHAFEALTAFARLNAPAAQKVRNHPDLRRMALAGLHLLLPDGTFPLLNDTTPPLGIKTMDSGGFRLAHIAGKMELAAAWWEHPAFHWALHKIYQEQPRSSWEGLVYGVDVIDDVPRPDFLSEHYCSDSIYLLRKQSSYVSIKNGPHGGEHDHMDRPGLYFSAPDGTRLAPDLGTVPYSLPLHYGWFKSTLAHNTVTLNGRNQTEPLWRHTYCQEIEQGILIASRIAWTDKEFVRHVVIGDTFIVDVFDVTTTESAIMDYMFHWVAEPVDLQSDPVAFDSAAVRGARPYQYLKHIQMVRNDHYLDWKAGAQTIRLLWAQQPAQQWMIAYAPDNPFISRDPLTLWWVRANGTTQRFIHAWDFAANTDQLIVNAESDRLHITLDRQTITIRTITIS